MNRLAMVVLCGALAAACGGVEAQRAQNAAPAVIEVHKDPTCGCCAQWVDHLRSSGFTVNVTDNDDMAAFKTQHGVPRQAQSCHTGVVDGYVVEGHVPAADIQRLLRERPAVAGLAVPGMPIGSPGMEVPGMAPQPFDTLTFARDGSTAVFASHNK